MCKININKSEITSAHLLKHSCFNRCTLLWAMSQDRFPPAPHKYYYILRKYLDLVIYSPLRMIIMS